MPAAPAIAAVAAAAGATASHVAGNKARAQARYAASQQLAESRRQFEETTRQENEKFQAQLAADQRQHNDNMAAMRNSLEQDRINFDRQLAQSQQGLYLQQQAMEQARADAQRALANQQAQMERQINANNTERQTFHKKESGVAGTILTGPGGIDQDELERKKKKHTLLGGA